MVTPISAGCYALHLRVGRQNSLLSPLLVRLYARLRQIPNAAVVAVIRGDVQGTCEARALVLLPELPQAKARNLLVAWAETTIDSLNHEYPYGTPGLVGSEPEPDADLCRIFVCCELADTALWLRGHADSQTAKALLVMSEHLPHLLSFDVALLKTALPVAISTVFAARCPARRSALSALVFANTPAGIHRSEMLRKRAALECSGRLVGHAGLPVAALPVFAQLVNALKHGIEVSGIRGAGNHVVRALLSQLGFAGPESDYLILLALPPKTWRTLQPRQGRSHAI